MTVKSLMPVRPLFFLFNGNIQDSCSLTPPHFAQAQERITTIYQQKGDKEELPPQFLKKRTMARFGQRRPSFKGFLFFCMRFEK